MWLVALLITQLTAICLAAGIVPFAWRKGAVALGTDSEPPAAPTALSLLGEHVRLA